MPRNALPINDFFIDEDGNGQIIFSKDYRRPTVPKVKKEPKEITITEYYTVRESYWTQVKDFRARAPYKQSASYKKYRIYSFYHPYVCSMISQLNRYGIDGLLDPKSDTENGALLLRQLGQNASFDFRSMYRPQLTTVDTNYPKEEFDFDFDGPYGIYNWEIFVHAPLLIASKLSQNQKFEEAQKWFHYVFNPTETEGPTPRRYWKVKPFYQHEEELNIEEILRKMASGDEKFNKELNQWMKNPFQPHAIARLRTVAYMKNVIMKYLENLIAWGDQLFRRDSIESINEATQLYILAAQILGPKPNKVTRPSPPSPRTVGNIVDKEEAGSGFTNLLVDIESEIGDIHTGDDEKVGDELNSLNSILYFCTKPNDKLLGYWDTVADRLFKIRNCQNIEGVERQLALFEPPIDPALLVKAAAAGLSIGDVLNNTAGTTLPNYRFRVLIQKAIELCNDVKSLGQGLLSALEKKDAEELSLLRASQEVNLLKAVRGIRKQTIEEGKENVASLEDARELAEIRREFYGSREFMSAPEEEQLKKIQKSSDFQLASQVTGALAGIVAALPDIEGGAAGVFGSPFLTFKGGGESAFNVLQGASMALNALSQIENMKATKAGIKGGYERRRDDWELQADLAEKEIEQIDKQIAAAEIRLGISERELVNHDMQIEQAQEVQDFMSDKYTNRDLYNWMITQISGMYFQSYQLAYDVARMAEQAFRYELSQESTFFIQFGHWDSLKKGLLAGERLQADLRRMEIAYLEQNKREYELTKNISLAVLSPAQLVNLRENGFCDIQLPEVLFDLDHPGQYMRRIKSVSVTIPAVTGPYTNVNAKLMLLSNRIRKNTEGASNASYPYTGINDLRFRHDVAGIQSISTSGGLNDSGMFELSFQDERYLPFEGAGAISSWRLELSSNYRQFDYDTISDVIIQMNYTAREGGNAMKVAAESVIQDGLNSFANQLVESRKALQRVFSLKTHFPNGLHQLLQPTATVDQQETTFAIKPEHFPYFLTSKALNLSDNVSLLLKLKDGSEVNPTELSFQLEYGTTPTVLATQPLVDASGSYPLPYRDYAVTTGSPINPWKLVATGIGLDTKLNSAEVEDIYLIVNYTIS